MKRIFVLAFALFMFQINNAQDLELGPKIGANFATLGDLEKLDNKIGFVGGGFLTIKFKKFDFQTEVLYSQQGDQFDLNEFDLDYINVPVLLRFYLIGSLNLQIGPQFGFLIEDNIPDSIENSFEQDTFDIAGIGGLGINLPLNLRADARYIFSVSKDFETVNFDDGFFALSIGFNFL